MRRLDHRVAALEQLNQSSHQFDAIVISFVRPRPKGPIYDEPIGYVSGMGGDGPRWMRQPGESLDDLYQRANREAPRHGPHGIVTLRELAERTEM